MNRLILTLIIFYCPVLLIGQFSRFSTINLSEVEINPAIAPLHENASIGFIYRRQDLLQGMTFTTNYVQGILPFKYSNNLRGAFTGFAVDDRTGIAGIYRSNALGFGYAMNVKLSDFDYLGSGIQMSYNRRYASLSGITTGSQFVQDRGFIGSDQGEPLGNFDVQFVSGDLGLFWEHTDDKIRRKAHLGVALYDFNRPNEAFFEEEVKVLSTWMVSGGARIVDQGRSTVYGDVLLRTLGKYTQTLAGINYQYEIARTRKELKVLELTARYWNLGYLAGGLQYHTSHMTASFNYDVPILRSNYGSSFEVGIVLKKLKAPRKIKKKSSFMYRKRVEDTTRVIREEVLPDELVADQEEEPTMGNQNRVIMVRPGEVTDLRPINFSDTVRFNFPTNESLLSDQIEEVLDVIFNLMQEHPELQVILTGHTDDTGTYAYNMKLGHKRAEEVAAFLMERGIEWDRIIVESEGESNPLLPNISELNRAKNRRVDVTFDFY